MTKSIVRRGVSAAWTVLVAATAFGLAGVEPVVVPRGTDAPVVTDGTFSPGEWDDALKIVAGEGVTLFLKELRDVVFVGVRGRQVNELGPTELSIAGSDGVIQKLHVSYGLYEVTLPPVGPEPSPRLGFTAGWYANELRRDEGQIARLQKEGMDPRSIMKATTYPSDGIEFAIRRSKIPGRTWRLRVWATGFFGGKPGAMAFPPEAAERATDGWLELRLQQAAG